MHETRAGSRSPVGTVRDLGVVAAGGAVGSIARHLLTLAIGGPEETGGFPVATLLINLSGAFLLGLLVEVVTRRGSASADGGDEARGSGTGLAAVGGTPDAGQRDARLRSVRLLLGTGVLGGFTTYSLLAADLAELLLGEFYTIVAVYALLTLLVGGAVSWCGVLVGRIVAGSRHTGARFTGPAASYGDQETSR